MPDSEKKAPTIYDSLEDRAKNSWPIAIIIASFAILSGAKGVMESIEYFSAKFFDKKEPVSEQMTQGVSLPAVRPDTVRIVPPDAVAVASKTEAPQPKKQSVVPASDVKPKEQANYTLPQIHSRLSKIFRQKGQAYRMELDETGKVGIFQKDGSYSMFMIQDIHLEWNSNNYTISLVSDKKSIIWHGISTFADGTRGWSTTRITGVMYSFSKSDFEEIKQLFAQYRKYAAVRKK